MRTIYIINSTQVVTSENHPEGLFSVKPGFPKVFDSKDYRDDEQRTFDLAEAEYRECESTMLRDTNDARVMQTITMERSDGKPFYHRSKGDFPTPEQEEEPEVTPEPEPEEEPQGE